MTTDPLPSLFRRLAGGLAVALGAVHTVAAPWEERVVLSRMARDGLWDTVTLEPDGDEAHRRSETLWVTWGSFGGPVLTTGALVLLLDRRGGRVPSWVGWATLAWGLPLTVVVPRSPAWTVPAIGALLIAAEHRERRPASGLPRRVSRAVPARTGAPGPRTRPARGPRRRRG